MRRRIRATLAFSAAVLRSLVRDRQALFFMLVLPVVVIVIIGTTFGGQGSIELGVVRGDDGTAARLVERGLRSADGIKVTTFDDADRLAAAVRRNRLAAGVVIPAGLDTDVQAGRPVTLGFVAGPQSRDTLTVRLAVQGVVDDVSARLGAAAFAAGRTGTGFSPSLAVAESLAGTGGVRVVNTDVGGGRSRHLSEFALTVPQNLVLFTFINALASAAFLVKTRRDGVLRRAMATRTSLGTLLTGLAIGWFALALTQAGIVVVLGQVAFGVNWGSIPATVLLVAVWALVGCGAGLLVGALGENEDRVGAVMPVLGLVLGALGGCMVPFEVFPTFMRRIALAVPHTWALNGFHNLVFDGGGVRDVAGSLAVLAGWAVGLVTSATVLLRRRLVRG